MDDSVEASLSDSSSGCTHLREIDSQGIVPDVLSFFGQKHTLAILYEFVTADRPLRFNELEEALDISSTTLTDRLKELVAEGFLTREAYSEIPPRVEYEATEKTHALTPIFQDLYKWADEYDSEASFGKPRP